MRKGFIIINLKEAALLKVIHGLSPNDFGDIIIIDNYGNTVLQNTDAAISTSESKESYIETITKKTSE